jgi:hypothetical protein
MSSNMLNMALFRSFAGEHSRSPHSVGGRLRAARSSTQLLRTAGPPPRPTPGGGPGGKSPPQFLPQPGLVANYVVVCVVDLRTTSGSKV